MVGFRKIVRVSSFYVGGTQGQGVLNHVFFFLNNIRVENRTIFSGSATVDQKQ